ncbi:hypothetical protein FHX58_007736 [Paraburkholderia tropica]|nr:hypothetical protein [Paraburkholderia tropica]
MLGDAKVLCCVALERIGTPLARGDMAGWQAI